MGFLKRFRHFIIKQFRRLSVVVKKLPWGGFGYWLGLLMIVPVPLTLIALDREWVAVMGWGVFFWLWSFWTDNRFFGKRR